jgi:UDP-2,3-diacylglucosamine hydrolase
LNKLSLGEPVWLASDIHLGPDNPLTAEKFYTFLARAREQAGALILLGDIFNVWIGDDWTQHPPVWLEKAIRELQHTGQTIPLYLLGGNRDFLISQKLAKVVQAQLLESATVLEVTARSTASPQTVQRYLIAHGDEFCTADHAYQRFRRLVRNKTVQRIFLSLPLSVRNAIAMRARKASLETERAPYDASYDVQDSSLSAILLCEQLDTCIHGHTHRPGHFPVQARPQNPSQTFDTANTLSRWVLPDWEFDGHESQNTTLPGASPAKHVQARGGWIEIDASGLRLIDLAGLDGQPASIK